MAENTVIISESKPSVIIGGTSPDVVVVEDNKIRVVTVGIQGPPGAQGEPGTSIPLYIHTQAVPSATWNVTHNLNTYPAITVVDSANSVVIGDAEYLDTNNVVLSFSAPFSGKAYLR